MKDRYELVPDFMRWMIKDHLTKRWIATINSLKDGEKIVFILNQFENSKIKTYTDDKRNNRS